MGDNMEILGSDIIRIGNATLTLYPFTGDDKTVNLFGKRVSKRELFEKRQNKVMAKWLKSFRMNKK